MNGSGPTVLEIFLWIVLANALLIAAAVILSRWLQSQSKAQVQKATEKAAELTARLSDIRAFLQHYQNVGYEPYVSPVQTLNAGLQQTEGQLRQLEQSVQEVSAGMGARGANQMRAVINAPVRWFQHSSQAKKLVEDSAAVEERMAAHEAETQRIYEIPWQVALEARKLGEQATEMARLAQSLKQKGASGSALQSALARIPTMQRSLNDIPQIYRRAEQPELLQNASIEETVMAHGVLSSVKPVADRWLPLLRTWDHHHAKTSSELNKVRQAEQSLRQTLAKPPEGVQAEPIQKRLERVTAMGSALAKRLEHPEVDDLHTIQREATRIRKLAEDAARQFSQAGALASELGRALPEITAALDALDQQMDSSAKQDRPLIWDISRPALEGLRKRVAALGPAGQARSAEEISAALAEIARVKSEHQDLNGRYQRVSGQHQSMVALLQSAEIQNGPAWIRRMDDMVEEAQVYDPRNWQRPDSVTTLKADLEALSALQDRLAPAGQVIPMKESSLGERLNDAQQLASMHKTVRPRAETIFARLEKIQALEKEAKDRLSGAWSVLEKTSILAESNDLLKSAASADIKRLRDELKRQGDDLNQRGQGVMDRKAQQVQAAAAEVYQAFQAWLTRLNNENTTLAKQVSDRLAALEAIAQVEDPPFEEARALLTRDDLRPPSTSLLKSPLGHRAARPEPMTEQEASAQIKRKNDLWQRLLSVDKALGEKSEPILQANHEALEARKDAQARIDELNAYFAQKKNWPPFNQAPLDDQQGLLPVDAKWDAMRKNPVRADWAILELGRLAGQYRTVEERAGQILDRIEQDQDRVNEVEDQIDDLKERWLYQAQSGQENALFFHGVQMLISGAEARLAHIRQQYMRGSLSYEDALKSLHLLYDELSASRVQVDDTRDVGLNNPASRPGSQHRQNGR